jgi:hypothetical protein
MVITENKRGSQMTPFRFTNLTQNNYLITINFWVTDLELPETNLMK